MSVHATPASASAPCAATMPYSTKFLPHLPHGCIAAPRTAMSLLMRRSRQRRPLPDDVLVLVVLVERAEHQLHLHADFEHRRVGTGGEPAEHDHLLVGQLDRADRVRHEGIG